MNKQYKVIWSKVRHCYVVVSELAKRSGKTKSGKAQAGQKVAVTLAVLALSLGMTGIAGAANNTAGSGSGVAVGSGSSASNASGVAIGAGATVNTDDGVAIGAGSVANVGSNGIGYIPLYTNLDGLEIFSPTWRSSLGAVSVGVQNAGEAATVTRQIVGVAAGSQDTDAVNVAQLKKLDTKIEKHRVHYFAVSTTDTDNNDNVNALGTDSMAIGPSARANVERSLAIGKSAKSYSVGGVALGADSYNIVPANMRGYIPTSVTLTDDEQTSPTWRSTLGAVAIGVSAENADGAITTATQTRQIVGVAAGTQDTDAVNVAQLKALGSTVDANKISFVSINKKSLGENDNENNDGATGDDAIAIGVFASATAPNATAMGQKAKATNYNSIALGDFANASGIGSTAVGDYAAAESHGSIAIGSEANATGMQSIALGDEAKGTGYQATVVGGEATASGINSLATGFGAKSSGHFSSSFGSEAVSDGAFATAIGSGANASAKSATALGESSTANIEGGVALGSDSKTNIGSGVLGYDPSGTITSQDVLLGNNKATYDNLQTEIATAQTNVTSLANQIIALQNEANTADETRQSEIIEQIKSLNTEFEAARADLQTKVSEANKLVSTWQATGAAVSVGDSETGLTRQITNVAAGTEDTDAVNVAQLNKLKVKVDKGWTLAVARGSDSKSENDATVEGDPKQINVGDTVTLEAGRGIKLKQDGAGVQIGLKYLDMEPKGDTYADAAASAEGALAVGQNSVASGTQGTAVGFANQATGKNSFAGGTEAVAGGDNSVAIGTNAITTDRESIAIGRGTGNATNGFKKVDSQYGVAIGSGAVVGEKSTSSVAIGGSAQVTTSGSATALGATAKVTNSVSGTAIGASATVSGSRNGTAIGRGAKVENVDYAVALGDQSLANVSAGVVGYDASGTDHTNDAAGTWKSGLGAVSVGKTGNTRQIINVAAGTEDTDAVNVAQLKAAGTAGLNFKGDGDTIIHRDLGATLNVVGGNTDSLTDNNIGVVADDTTGTLNVKLAKNLTMGDGSITFVPTGAKDANGNTLVQGEDGKWYTDLSDATYDATNNVYTKADGTTVSAVENPVVSSVKLTNTGLDNGGNKITNVAAGTEDTDIVNLGQLKGSMIKSSDVTYGADGSGTITLTMQDGSKVTIDSLKDTFVKEAKLENNTLTFTRNDDTSFEVGDIASKSDMDSAISSANLKFTGDDTSVDSTITKKNGEILNVLGGASEFTTANNIGVVKENDALKVKLAKNLTMGDGSITFAPTGAKDADGNTLVQGEDGKWYSDLSGATYDATNNVYTKA
ncbi:ESPR-type extended signal peptide-containing protein, partial [Megasphaera sp. MJR8396C]|uniref:ESPR-type extended signal peptide-containing protein n=4 Tax=Megasphaera TaxID=906 RepID=UPI000782974B